ncbi:MAG: pilus assembly PilX N-terminal domain-containing protein [Smithellaceae bacterium]|jgi:Tfp pilus assembly protein PilX
MCRVYKRTGKKRNSEDGFVLVAALIAIMILMAIGVYALTTASQDISSTARSVSEGNALSAAEAGVQTLSATFDPNNLADIPNTAVQGSTNASFNVTGLHQTDAIRCQTCCRQLPCDWKYFIYDAHVTGFDKILNGQVNLQIGIMDPNPKSP